MKKSKISKAIAIAVTGTVFSVGAVSTASAHVMYNKFTTSDPGDTDGWVWGGIGATSSGDPANANPGFAGTTGGAAPFGYTGASHLNWAAMIHNAGDSLTVSAADAQADYGITAEIDTAQGAWFDGTTGWKHQTDVGLIKSMVTQNVTLNLTTLDASKISKFGISIFDGMDQTQTGYGHHGKWNDSTTAPVGTDNPFYGGAPGQLAYITSSDNVTDTLGLTFTAQAGDIYSVYLGGTTPGSWLAPVAGYELNISTSPVPVPAAVWLFGSAMAGLGVAGRRKKS